MAGIEKVDKHARVGGSGFTWFTFRGTIVGWAQSLGYTSPQPVAEPATIQPLNYRRPAEILVPRAIGGGTLTVTAFEVWNQPVWGRLVGMDTAADLADVFELMWQSSDDLQATVVIDVPKKRQKGNVDQHVKTFHQVVISDIRDDEQIDITTMAIQKPITFMYAWQEDSRVPNPVIPGSKNAIE